MSSWPDVVASLKAFVRAIYASVKVIGARDGALVLGVPNEPHRARCEQHRADVEAAIAAVVGARVPIELQIDHGSRGDDPHDPGDPGDDTGPVRRAPAPARAAGSPAPSGGGSAGPVGGGARAAAGGGAAPGPSPMARALQAAAAAPFDDPLADVVPLHPDGAPTPDEEIDLDDLVDAPPEHVLSPIDRLAQAFPGSELLDEPR